MGRKLKDFTKSKAAVVQRTPISGDPVGFENEEKEKSNLDIRSEEFKTFVNQDKNKKRFEIGVAVRVDDSQAPVQDGSSIQLHGGHAFVSIKELPHSDGEQPFIVTFNDTPAGKLPNYTLSPPGGDRKLYRVHIHFPSKTQKEWLELSWEERHGPTIVNYIPICIMTTTVRFLKQIALRSVYEGDHSIIVNDCSTVARNFIERLLEYLLSEQTITPAEKDEYMRKWVSRINIEDESVGDSEGKARDSNRKCTVM